MFYFMSNRSQFGNAYGIKLSNGGTEVARTVITTSIATLLYV